MKVAATVGNIEVITDFVNDFLESVDCPMQLQMKIAIAIDEIMSNLAFYAYDTAGGEVVVQVEAVEEPNGISLTFIDDGRPYNPLKKEDPDITLSAEEREIGGMGIFMVKKLMDEVKYEYVNSQNRLVLQKNWS